jgi:hypothetical protein
MFRKGKEFFGGMPSPVVIPDLIPGPIFFSSAGKAGGSRIKSGMTT